MSTAAKLSLALTSLITTFIGGIVFGLYLNDPKIPEPLEVAALQNLRQKMAELGAIEAVEVIKWRDVIKIVPAEVSDAAQEITEAARREPETATAFSLEPDLENVVMGEEAEVAEVLEACLPQEFSVNGVIQSFGIGGPTSMIARLYHKHDDVLVWASPLRGNLTHLSPPLPPKPIRWMAGPLAGFDEDGELLYGGLAGHTWRHAGIIAGIDSRPSAWMAFVVRW